MEYVVGLYLYGVLVTWMGIMGSDSRKARFRFILFMSVVWPLVIPPAAISYLFDAESERESKFSI